VQERYSIHVTARADRDLQRLPEKIATACVEFIFGPLADNPRQVGKPLRGEFGGLRSARRGDYRVIYGIVDDARAVEIIHVDRRSADYSR
jgi:mRNA-degrading endonuclease RelE of RelBE toxin-antitoxin system